MKAHSIVAARAGEMRSGRRGPTSSRRLKSGVKPPHSKTLRAGEEKAAAIFAALLAFWILAVLIGGAGAGAPAFDHADFDAVLKKRVDAKGFVDYAGLHADRAALDAYAARLGTAGPAELAAWPEPDQIAFYINAYNAITLVRIIDHYPPTGSDPKLPKVSIRNIDGAWDKIKNRVAGEEITLDHLEHEILRKRWKEPRIHMAIVCAGASCPRLRNEAYTGAKLEEQLNSQSEDFVRDATKNNIDAAANIVTLSPIFDWYWGDFWQTKGEAPSLKGGEKRAGPIGFVILHGDPAAKDFLRKGGYEIRNGTYDWSLNGR